MASGPSRSIIRESLVFDRVTRCACRGPTPRYFSSTPSSWSGHSKWATIKHDKAKADAVKNKQRTVLSKDIANAVKASGPNPNNNPRLALALSIAKKAGLPKSNIENAIARGQGLSASGAALESVTLEAMLPPSIATVIDCQTDSKLRTLADLRLLVKDHGGNVTPIGYLFEKKGKIVLRQKEGLSIDDIIDPAIEAGALDVVEDDQGRIVLYTEPTEITAAAEKMTKEYGHEIEETELIYDPNADTKVELNNEDDAKQVEKFLEKLPDIHGVQGVYLNWAKGSISEEAWAELQSKTDL